MKLNSPKLFILFPFILILLLASALASSILQKKKILVLHSYHPEYAWTRDITVGWKRRFKVGNKGTVRYHYMDTKRFPDKESKRKAGMNAMQLISRWKPDIIVPIDDDAQILVGKNFVNDNNMSIVYAGVNNDPAKYGYFKANNVYGIKENLVLEPLRETLNQYQLKLDTSKPIKIAHLSDWSSFSQSVTQSVRGYDWTPHDLVFSIECKTFDEWKSGLKRANREADIVFITNYHTLMPASETTTSSNASVQTVKGPDVIQWASDNVEIPMFGAWGFLVEDGGMMSLSVSPFEQGETAAELAQKIVFNDYIPPGERHILNDEVQVYIRPKRMKKWGWILPNIYTSYARATGSLFQ